MRNSPGRGHEINKEEANFDRDSNSAAGPLLHRLASMADDAHARPAAPPAARARHQNIRRWLHDPQQPRYMQGGPPPQTWLDQHIITQMTRGYGNLPSLAHRNSRPTVGTRTNQDQQRLNELKESVVRPNLSLGDRHAIERYAVSKLSKQFFVFPDRRLVLKKGSEIVLEDEQDLFLSFVPPKLRVLFEDSPRYKAMKKLVRRIVTEYVDNCFIQVDNSIQKVIEDFDVRKDGGIYRGQEEPSTRHSTEYALNRLLCFYAPLDMVGRCKILHPSVAWKTFIRRRLQLVIDSKCVDNQILYAFHEELFDGGGGVRAGRKMNPHTHMLRCEPVVFPVDCDVCYDTLMQGESCFKCGGNCDYSLCEGCLKTRIGDLVKSGEEPGALRTLEEERDVVRQFNGGDHGKGFVLFCVLIKLGCSLG